MKNFEDIFEVKIEIEESDNDQVLAKIKFPWGKADSENKNKRTYPFEIFKTAVEKLSEKIKRAFVPGQTDHPISGSGTRLSDVSHILKSVWLDEHKMAWATADILKTSRGMDVLRIIKSGIQMGASLRGFGEVKNGQVQKGLEIASVDLVCNPSFGDDAKVGVNNIVIESTILARCSGELSLSEKMLSGAYNPQARLKEEKVEKREKTNRQFYAEFLEAGGICESFEDWKKKYGQ